MASVKKDFQNRHSEFVPKLFEFFTKVGHKWSRNGVSWYKSESQPAYNSVIPGKIFGGKASKDIEFILFMR